MNNIETFKDTLQRIELDPLLGNRAKHSIEGTVLISPHTLSEKIPVLRDTKVFVKRQVPYRQPENCARNIIGLHC